jgi:hypothetical protein
VTNRRIRRVRTSNACSHKGHHPLLIVNHQGLAFWHAVGFADYCLTLELPLCSASQLFPFDHEMIFAND